MFKYLPIDSLVVGGSNVRDIYGVEAMASLKASVRQYGVQVPLLVRECGSGYEVLDGGRRLQVARELGLSEVPCVVGSDGADKDVALAWVCNFEREAVPFVAEAQFFGMLLRGLAVTVEELGVKIGRSSAYVRSRLAVLEWPAVLLSYCTSFPISYSVAREYARLGDSVELGLALDWDRVNGPSSRQALAYVDAVLLARETVVTPQMKADGEKVYAPVCDACGGELDWSKARNLKVCGDCLKAIEGVSS